LTPINDGYKQARTHEDQKGMVDNPFSHWPVNWPCFCGSGDKFKKCCSDKMSHHVSSRDAQVLKADYEKQLVHVKNQMDLGVWYKTKKPIYEDAKAEPGGLE
jgi:hypothetical protein